MKKRSGLYPRVGVDAAGSGVVSQAGGVTLVETLRVSGLDAALSRALAPWRKPTATHDPAKVVCDLALTLAVGGDCLADVAVLRAEPASMGQWPRIRRCRARSTRWPATPLVSWRRSTPPAPGHARTCGGWPASMPRTPVPTPTGRWWSRRDAGHGALGEGAGRADVQARVRVPPVVGVR